MTVVAARDGSFEVVDLAGGPSVEFVGVVSPMTSLGLAPFSYLGVVGPDGLVLSSAALYQVTFSRQQQRIVDDLLATPYEELVARDDVRVHAWDDVERVELVRQFAVGYRLHLTMRDGSTTRLIVQQRRVDTIRRCLSARLGDRWVDDTATAA